ncbi:MAG TPA: phosphoribosylformylglycinamidine synthase subunit PurS [Thermoanaerobaculia bacterium]|nr:phosphoribosylformylglycinamidine synthase subunit PurS [Thermoanaerobaculia bacterium]
MTVLVRVFLKSGVLDPQGKAINDALHRLGYGSVVDVRAGKIFRLEMEGADPASALTSARKLADQLLANPVIEDFEVELGPAEVAR